VSGKVQSGGSQFEEESTAFEELAAATIASMTVSVVVRAFTEKRLLDTRAAIDSALQQDRRPDEVLVVIDKNPNLLATLRSDYNSNELVRVIPNERIKGIGGGSNTALIHAKGEIVAYLDDDAVADPSWLGALIEPLVADQSIVGVGGLTLPEWVDGEPPSWFPEEFNWAVGCSNPEPNLDASDQQVREIRNVWGGNNALRRQILVEYGGFAEKGIGRLGSRPLGGEDTELCIRIRQHEPSARFVFQPKAIIRHKVPGSRLTLRYFYNRCCLEGLSKALLAQQLGSQVGLRTEASYATNDLPKAVCRRLIDGVRRRRLAEFGKAAAIVAGLGMAAAGMFYGRASIAIGRIEALAVIDGPLAPANADAHR